MAAETARQPYAAFDFTDLRHAMDRSPEGSVPQMGNLDASEVRKRPPDIVGQRSPDKPRICFPGAHAARPLQAVASDDAIVIVGTIGIADCAAIADDVVQDLADRLCDHDEGRDRQ